MLFPTFTFGVFFIAVFVLHVVLRRNSDAWRLMMVGASYFFYGWWNWRFCGLLAASTVFNWWVGKTLWRFKNEGDEKGKALLAFGIAVNLGVLAFFKYVDFFVETINSTTGTRLSLVNILLPIGISFFTFQAISYIIDIRRGRLNSANLSEFALYLSFFPQLVAGPIVRANEFLPQVEAARNRSWIDTGGAGWLIARGLAKKVVVANYLAENIVDPVWAAPNAATKTELIMATYGYAVQIYADFSGYTDMAIGIALMFGFRFPQNFDRPYSALSVGEFWQRWHMTLSRWLRDYLYVPLGGNRHGRKMTYRNLLFTMLLGGLWHGAAWNFVAWGGLLGGFLVAERMAANRWGPPAEARSVSNPRVLAHWFVTFHLICLSWILFRAPTIDEAGDFLTGLLKAPTGALPSLIAVMVIGGAIAVQLVPTGWSEQVKQRFFAMEPIIQGATFAIWIAVVVAAGPEGVSPFIYFQF